MIWDKLPKPFFCLAPMEDVTDVVFRQVVLKAGRPDVFFTEFTNVSGFCHPQGRKSVSRRLQFLPNEKPIVAQIWGNKPKDFTKTATELCKMGFNGIDINMGCPDKAVVKSGGGSALINNPELAVEIIQAVKKGIEGSAMKGSNLGLAASSAALNSTRRDASLSVKTRIGFSKVEEWKPWLTTLLGQDLDALTVHLRTRKEMSKVPAHRELIPDIIKLRNKISPRTKLIINGDVRDRTHGIELAKQYPGIDGLMIGRGIFVNPFCFEPKPKEHSQKELIKLLKYHLDLFDKFSVGFSARDSEQASDSKRSEPRDIPMQSGDPVTRSAPLESCSSLDVRNSLSKNPIKFEPLKKFFKIYVNNFPGASELRAKLIEAKNTDEAREVLKLVPTAPITGGQAPEIGAGQVVASSSSRKSQSSKGVASE